MADVRGDALKAQRASDLLLRDHGIYVQPINYPTVPRGTERLRMTATPLHTLDHMRELREALVKVFNQLSIPRSRACPADIRAAKPLAESDHLPPVRFADGHAPLTDQELEEHARMLAEAMAEEDNRWEPCGTVLDVADGGQAGDRVGVRVDVGGPELALEQRA